MLTGNYILVDWHILFLTVGELLTLEFVCQEDQHEPLLNSLSQLKDVLCSVAGT